MRGLRSGVLSGASGVPWPELLRVWQRADELGAVGRDPDEIEIGVLLRTELQAESTYRTWVAQGSPFIDQERERLGAEGYRGAELEEEVRKSIWTQFLPIDEDRAAQRLREYAAVGVSHFIVIHSYPYDYARLERFVERVIPEVDIR